MDQVRALVSDDFEQVNRLIQSELHSNVPLVVEVARYIVGAGGKRIRPLVVLLASRACNYSGFNHLKLAVLIEFLHTATLLHDDVVDCSALRRGKHTVNTIWSNSASILVGDFLYSRSFQLMVQIRSIEQMAVISDATNCIAEGEVMQLQNVCNADLSEPDYLEVIKNKTAMLFQAAAECGAILADAEPSHTEALKHYGYHIGMSFQLIDDVLDFTGDRDTMGKNVGNDLAEGKPTLPLIYTINNGSKSDVDLIRSAIQNRTTQQLSKIMDVVRNSGALNYCRNLAQKHTHQAINSLQALDQSKFCSGLESLAVAAMSRSR